MKDDDALPVSTPTSTSAIPLKKEISLSASAVPDHSSFLFGRGRYKCWAFAAIILLAFWSIVTGTVTLRWSAANLNKLSRMDSLDFPIPDDLDVLEMEEREKLVRQMWDVYTSNGRRIGLAKFWEDAFKSAYEDMTSEAPGVQNEAISEIAKMSLHSIRLESPHSSKSMLETKSFLCIVGAYDEEEDAARAYDLAAIKYWGTSTFTNFLITDYESEIEIMQTVTKEEYLASLRRIWSSGDTSIVVSVPSLLNSPWLLIKRYIFKDNSSIRKMKTTMQVMKRQGQGNDNNGE